MASQSATKQQKNKVDYGNVILALPAHFPSSSKKKMPRAVGEKGATTSRKTTTGQREKRNAALPSDGPTEGRQRKKYRKAATRDAVTTGYPSGQKDVLLDVPGLHDMKQQSGLSKEPDNVSYDQPIQQYTEPNVVNNEQLIPEEQSGIVHQQNLANATEDILPGNPAEEANVVNNEEPIVEEQAEEANVVNNEEPIVEEQAEEANVVNNEEPIVEEQPGIMQQQNLANDQQDIPAAEDPAIMDDIFDFPLNNQLLDDIDFQLNDGLD